MMRVPAAFLVAILVAAASLTGARFLMPELSRMRAAFSYGDPKQLPPEMAVVKLLGGFRGWFINYLWLRANELQEQKEYHEALQLAKLITSLQPNFERVWDFQASNLAWNIAAATTAPAERWLWVEQGLRLLVDAGIPRNPYSRLLHQAVARIYQGKIHGDMDRAHWYFKRQVAERWSLLLGAPPEERSREAFLQWSSAVALAPRTLTEIAERDSELASLMRAEIELGRGLDLAFCEEFMAAEANRAESIVNPTDGLGRWLASPDGAAGRSVLLSYARARVLRERERMDPALMHDLIGWFGPLDWRHPVSHTLYWAVQGHLRHAARRIDVRIPWVAPGLEGRSIPSEVQDALARIEVRQALSILVSNGEVHFDAATGEFYFVPCPGFLVAEALAVSMFVTDDPGFEELQRRRLADCVLLCVVAGDLPRAETFYAEWKRRFAAAPAGTALAASAADFVPEYLVAQIVEQPPAKRPEVAAEHVKNLLFLGWREGLAASRADVTERFQAIAQEVAERARSQGIEMPAFDEAVVRSLADYLEAPPADVPPNAKARLWNHERLPQALRDAVFERVKSVVLGQFERYGIDARYFRREALESGTPPLGPGTGGKGR